MTSSVATLESSDLAIDENRALWPDVYPGTSISVEYLFGENQLKENIILEEKIQTPGILEGEKYLLLEMPIEFPSDLFILTDGQENKGGWITSDNMDFLHEDEVVYTINAPIAVDAQGDTFLCEYLSRYCGKTT